MARLQSQWVDVKGLHMVEHNLMQELQDTENRIAFGPVRYLKMLRLCKSGRVSPERTDISHVSPVVPR
eukprot:12935945-Prorocentrum_lima.AAC.1